MSYHNYSSAVHVVYPLQNGRSLDRELGGGRIERPLTAVETVSVLRCMIMKY